MRWYLRHEIGLHSDMETSPVDPEGARQHLAWEVGIPIFERSGFTVVTGRDRAEAIARANLVEKTVVFDVEPMPAGGCD